MGYTWEIISGVQRDELARNIAEMKELVESFDATNIEELAMRVQELQCENQALQTFVDFVEFSPIVSFSYRRNALHQDFHHMTFHSRSNINCKHVHHEQCITCRDWQFDRLEKLIEMEWGDVDCISSDNADGDYEYFTPKCVLNQLGAERDENGKWKDNIGYKSWSVV